jgi:membrane-bound lytic murein transglycosylase B
MSIRRVRVWFLVVVVCGVVAVRAQQVPTAEATPSRPPFADWIAAVRADALAQGLDAGIVDAALGSAERLEVVLERDTTQAEFVLSIDKYLQRRLTKKFVRTAREQFGSHKALLRRVGEHYGVDPAVLASVWGVESNFGKFAGVRPTISVLSTLGYESRRADFFRGELLDALRILSRGDIALANMRGSWAGAMGQPQFMPSSYLKYAVDFDADGRRDIWASDADVFASIANYLKLQGWATGERWGRQVKVPAVSAERIAESVPSRTSGCRAVRALSEPQPLRRWRELGVTLPNGQPLPRSDMIASLLHGGSRTFLVYRNYETILAYNCANTYALSVVLLADRIGAGR